ncbi:MAG: cytochrome c family protein [Verrucomicrobia bacterium]|nr:cytochrome c family protein [Verrucomicrobiota bacterium]
MKPYPKSLSATAMASVILTSVCARTGSAAQCNTCHPDMYAKWSASVHADTQADVASELSQSDLGMTPAGVIQTEDCVACHAPTAVQVNGGMMQGNAGMMTDSQALGYFFTTTDGQFSGSTAATNTTLWPHVACTACHAVPTNHVSTPDAGLPSLASFDSRTGTYVSMTNASQLCGQCHGNLRFADTDHQIYNAWTTAAHGNTQATVAGELSDSDVGLTPAGVVSQVENCVACHAPTAVLANGGMNEAQALDYFFTTTNGQFATNTTPTHSAEWPNVACIACHDPHDPGGLSYFNSTTMAYQRMTNSMQLCGQCHGTLRFGDLSKVCDVSFNIVSGIGGMGVTNQQTMPGVLCTDCHMYSTDVDGSNSKNFHGHSWAITVQDPDGTSTTSCTHCHGAIDTLTANAIIDTWKSEFQSLDATASANVAQAAAALQGAQNTNWFASLQEAQYNLALAEADGSGGFHNHKYAMALLNDANTKVLALPILTAAVQGTNVVISWTAAGLLQSAGSLAGPWQDMTNATSPLTLHPATQIQQQFYRLRP